MAACAFAAVLSLTGCGGNVELDVTHSDNRKRINGTVELPNGELAAASSWWQRVAAVIVAQAHALTGNADPVGAGIRVEVVRLSREAAAAGQPGTFVDAEDTAADGSYTVILPQGTDANTCRFLVQVGAAADGTLTRAFVYSSDEPIRIDFRSEAAVRLVLAEVPPADLCSFDNAEIAAIVTAVDTAPGNVNADNVADANAAATTAAGGNGGVQNAIAAALQ